MAKKRCINNEIISRINRIDNVIKNWMRLMNISETDPEGCMPILVEKGIYDFDTKGKAHHFREDLRTLRDCSRIDIFPNLIIDQIIPRARWVIRLKL